MIWSIVLLSAVTVERLFELTLAKRNTARLLRMGAREFSPGHYPLIVLLHALWIAGLWIFGWNRSIQVGWLVIFAGLQLLRVWIVATLGQRWTTRIIVLPGAPLVRNGPYRFLTHPNYVVVIGEIAVLPLVFGLPRFALAFSCCNALVLAWRIRAEAAALTQSSRSEPVGPRDRKSRQN
jgi:methyltransferase